MASHSYDMSTSFACDNECGFRSTETAFKELKFGVLLKVAVKDLWYEAAIFLEECHLYTIRYNIHMYVYKR